MYYYEQLRSKLTLGDDLSPSFYFLKADGFNVGKIIKVR